MFYANYVKLCNSIGKTPSAVAIEIGISKSIVSRWKNGGGVTDANIQKVADYFGVSTEVLTGEKEKPHTEDDVELDAATIELKSIWDSADDDERRALLEMARLIKKRRND